VPVFNRTVGGVGAGGVSDGLDGTDAFLFAGKPRPGEGVDAGGTDEEEEEDGGEEEEGHAPGGAGGEAAMM